MSLLARRYATALHLAAQGQDAVAAVLGDLQALHGGLLDPTVQALLQSPDVTSAQRTAVLDKLAAGRHVLVGNLLAVVRHRRRLELLPDLYPEYRALVMAAAGEVDGVVETPLPLGDGELAELAALAGRLSGKRVTLTQQVRPDLIGGVRLFVGNVLFDGSVRTSLDQLEQRLRHAPV